MPERISGAPVSAGDDPLSAVASEVHRHHGAARELIGAGRGTTAPLPKLKSVLAESGAGWYAFLALGLFAFFDEASAYIFAVLGPDISDALGWSPSSFTSLTTTRQVFAGVTAMSLAKSFHTRQNRAATAKRFGLQYGLALSIGGLLTWVPAFTGVIGALGSASGTIPAAHRPLIMDSYPPAARLRVLALHRAAAVVGAITGPVLVAVLAGAANLTWRGTLLASGSTFFVLSFLGLRLRDPGIGRFDTDRVAALLHPDGAEICQVGDPSELGFWDSVRRVSLIPTVRRMLGAWAVLGVAVTPVVTYQGFYLQEQFSYSASQRAIFYSASWLLALPALWFVGRVGEHAWLDEPARLLRLSAAGLVILAVGLALAVVPILAVSFVGFAVSFASEAVVVVTLSMMMMTVVRPRSRPIAGALGALLFGLVGGEGGSLVLGGIVSRYSITAAVLALCVPAVVAALVVYRAIPGLDGDLDALVDEVLEDEGVHSAARAGAQLPLLACRGLSFSFGQLQVLFDVDFSIEEGEMLALLGTNGAGKSTLLNLISGVYLPSSGSMRLQGTDITFLDAHHRVPLGITQIPGGRSVFGPLTVLENLKLLGYSVGADRKRLDGAIEECFAAFPSLAKKSQRNASALSGGEQQMLAVCKALILRPKLLLIDELSLGLAPIVVDQLLSMVREINSRGTAVVLVEQSINVALNVVDHAYFMEKGEIRFDGSAEDLLGHDDLLRAVFLGTAAGGLG